MLPADADCAIANRSAAGNFGKHVIQRTVMAAALGRQSQIAAAENVIAAEILHGGCGHDRKIRRRTVSEAETLSPPRQPLSLP